MFIRWSTVQPCPNHLELQQEKLQQISKTSSAAMECQDWACYLWRTCRVYVRFWRHNPLVLGCTKSWHAAREWQGYAAKISFGLNGCVINPCSVSHSWLCLRHIFFYRCRVVIYRIKPSSWIVSTLIYDHKYGWLSIVLSSYCNIENPSSTRRGITSFVCP